MDATDSILIFPPGASGLASAWASAIQLGSWLDAEVGVDYGAKGLIRSVEAGNALVDGGRFGYRSAPIRHMAVPLVISPSPALYEGMLARAAMPGAIIAVQPEGVPSSQAVYFDVIDGRYEPAHNIFHNRVGVRKGMLYLDTQPFGYWPTEILLASAASVGWAGMMAVNGASVIGDVPPLAHVIIAPTAASVYVPGTWYIDMAAWSLGGRASFQPLIPPAAFAAIGTAPNATGYGGASLGPDKFAPASQAWTYIASPVQYASAMPLFSASVNDLPWTALFDSGASGIPSSLEPAYRGRFRVFAFARMTPSSYPWQLMVDAQRQGPFQNALASSNQIATWYSAINASIIFVTGATDYIASAYSIYDCGELTLPPQGSGFQGPVSLRVWAAPPSGAAMPSQLASGAAPATVMNLRFGGLYLLPVDGAAGILTAGLAQPTIGGFQQGAWGYGGTSPASGMTQAALELNNGFVDSVLAVAGTAAASQILGDVRAFHRGVSPRIGASTTQIAVLTGDKLRSATQGISNVSLEFSRVSVSYRPQFQFLYGI